MDSITDLCLMISEDLVPQSPVKPSDIESLFPDLLDPALKLQTNLTKCGGHLWPAGLVLAEYLIREKLDDLRGMTMFVTLDLSWVPVVDLSGRLAIALKLRQLPPTQCKEPTKVHVTDGVPALMPLLQQNISLNFPDPASHVIVQAHLLPWGGTLDPAIPKRPEVILAADCAYIEESFPSLTRTLEEMLGEQTTLWFCYKKRRRRDRDCIKMIGKIFDVHFVRVTLSISHHCECSPKLESMEQPYGVTAARIEFIEKSIRKVVLFRWSFSTTRSQIEKDAESLVKYYSIAEEVIQLLLSYLGYNTTSFTGQHHMAILRPLTETANPFFLLLGSGKAYGFIDALRQFRNRISKYQKAGKAWAQYGRGVVAARGFMLKAFFEWGLPDVFEASLWASLRCIQEEVGYNTGPEQLATRINEIDPTIEKAKEHFHNRVGSARSKNRNMADLKMPHVNAQNPANLQLPSQCSKRKRGESVAHAANKWVRGGVVGRFANLQWLAKDSVQSKHLRSVEKSVDKMFRPDLEALQAQFGAQLHKGLNIAQERVRTFHAPAAKARIVAEKAQIVEVIVIEDD
ncbi:uncharacterized protein KY384_007019 [Bacidia gigantensis]|uniref:uncharacterized protein n=1 Tax=Bacidia gigantensis TaxID=2732470 RepID=UPI001D038ACD|nr:uncharacterized protein KY384_007019 [Bacidia gigantensis]KAG8528103.1 hypothetical protein KY384_007019 [Bacidia gigantensis]